MRERERKREKEREREREREGGREGGREMSIEGLLIQDGRRSLSYLPYTQQPRSPLSPN